MSERDVFTILTEIIHDTFFDETITVTDDLTAKEVEGWDSLGHIRLIVAIEKHWDIRFSAAEISEMANVGELVDIICGKL